jgi:hypothetical protein
MTGEPPSGPLPDVLARLATDMPASDTGRGRSARARVLGWVLMIGAVGLVIASAIVVAQP